MPPRLLGVGRDHPALAGRDLLVRIEGEDRVDSVGAHRLAVVLGAQGLAGVLDQRQPVLRAQLAQRVQLARVAEDVDRDDRLRLVRDRSLDGGGIEVHRPLVHVREDGHRAFVDEAVGRGDEGVRRGDHLVPLPEAADHREQVQARGARGDGSRERRSDLLGEELLEAVDRRPEREPPRPKHLEHELLVALVEVRRRERDRPRGGSHAWAGVLSPTATRSSQ